MRSQITYLFWLSSVVVFLTICRLCVCVLIVFLWTIYVFGSCFRMLSVILVSDFCVQNHWSFHVMMLVLGLVIAQGSHTHRVRFQHTAGLLCGSYTLSNSEAHALFSTSTSRHLSRKSWNTGDSLFFSLISGFPFVAIKYSACKGHTEKQSD